MFNALEYLNPLLNILEHALLTLLVFLEAVILWIFARRLIAYAKAKGNAPKWMNLLSQGLADGSIPAITLSSADKATVAGRLVKTGLANINLAPEAMEKLFDIQEAAEKRDLDRGLFVLATVGSNAPFIGLTGTVIGILIAFDRFAASGGKGSTEVMLAISHALIATVVGLMVAIPAVVFYNVLRAKSRAIIEGARDIRMLLMARSLQNTFSNQEV